ncbi:hypothetical protein ABZ023_17850 [Streptomyces sp. NPDC006367]
MRWIVTPRRRKPNSHRWVPDRAEFARWPWPLEVASLPVARPA